MTERDTHVARLFALATQREQGAQQARQSRRSAQAERQAQEWEADARAIRWALHELENGA